MRFHPIGGGPKTMKTDKKNGSRQEPHLLSDRLEIELITASPAGLIWELGGANIA